MARCAEDPLHRGTRGPQPPAVASPDLNEPSALHFTRSPVLLSVRRSSPVFRAISVLAVCVTCATSAHAQVVFRDAADRDAFRRWFVVLADAQFYRPTPDVTDCAALVRHAVREALRSQSPDWIRHAGLPGAVVGAGAPREGHRTGRRAAAVPRERREPASLRRVRRREDAGSTQRPPARTRRGGPAPRRPSLLPAARRAHARPPDGVRRPLRVRGRRQRLGRLPHRPLVWRRDVTARRRRGAQGQAGRPCRVTRPSAGGPCQPTTTSSGVFRPALFTM